MNMYNSMPIRGQRTAKNKKKKNNKDNSKPVKKNTK
jgi:ribosomal protein S13